MIFNMFHHQNKIALSIILTEKKTNELSAIVNRRGTSDLSFNQETFPSNKQA